MCVLKQSKNSKSIIWALYYELFDIQATIKPVVWRNIQRNIDHQRENLLKICQISAIGERKQRQVKSSTSTLRTHKHALSSRIQDEHTIDSQLFLSTTERQLSSFLYQRCSHSVSKIRHASVMRDVRTAFETVSLVPAAVRSFRRNLWKL